MMVVLQLMMIIAIFLVDDHDGDNLAPRVRLMLKETSCEAVREAEWPSGEVFLLIELWPVEAIKMQKVKKENVKVLPRRQVWPARQEVNQGLAKRAALPQSNPDLIFYLFSLMTGEWRVVKYTPISIINLYNTMKRNAFEKNPIYCILTFFITQIAVFRVS